jgi:S1-C subfamily serine protease
VRFRTSSRRLALAALGAASLLLPSALARAGGTDATSPAEILERELEGATKSAMLATVFCVAKGAPAGSDEIGSSGVIVSRSGYVLTDADVGAYDVPRPGAAPDVRDRKVGDLVEVRVPDAKRKFVAYAGKVVARIHEVDSALVKITNPPPSGLPFLPPRTAQDLRVGAYTFVLGTPFGHDESGSAAETLGIVAALVPAPETATGGRWSEIETSAAVNPGVNGGPLLDADGALVGIISTWGDTGSANPFQLLGKAYPIDRIRAAYRDRPEAEEIFRDTKPAPVRSKQAELMETAYGLAGERALRSVVSLEIERTAPLVMVVGRNGSKDLVLPRYSGPVSALALSKDGWIVTSLYNVGNVTFLGRSLGGGDVEQGVGGIKRATAWLADGTAAPAKFVADDQRLGIALFKADLPPGKELVPVEPAPPTSAQVGRIVLCVGNPFGSKRPTSPLLTVGVFSRLHPCDCEGAWRGSFQTDAGITDGNIGGALVDVHGRTLGMATLWDPALQGRSSGVGFGIPIERILAALPGLQAGTSVKVGFVGIRWLRRDGPGRVDEVTSGSPAEKAGMKPGDVIVAIDGKAVPTFEEAAREIRLHDAGARIKITVEREGSKVELDVTLGESTALPW